MTLLLLHDQYGGRGKARDPLRDFAKENLPKDRVPRRPQYHEIEILAGPCDARMKTLGSWPETGRGPLSGREDRVLRAFREKLELMGGNG